MNPKLKMPAIALLCALATACGGGDGGDDGGGGGGGGGGSPSAAEGHWVGTANGEDELSGNSIDMMNFVVLENGQLWGVYGYSTGSILGGWFGQTSAGNGQLSGSGTAYRVGADGGTANGSMSATFTAQGSMSGQIADVASFTVGYDATYDQAPAPVSKFAANYNALVGVGHASYGNMLFTIDASGNVTPWVVRGQPNCGANGSIKPRASGKNVYDVHLVVQGVDCPLVNGTVVDGIALYNPDAAAGRPRLLVMGDSAQHTGFFIYTR